MYVELVRGDKKQEKETPVKIETNYNKNSGEFLIVRF